MFPQKQKRRRRRPRAARSAAAQRQTKGRAKRRILQSGLFPAFHFCCTNTLAPHCRRRLSSCNDVPHGPPRHRRYENQMQLPRHRRYYNRMRSSATSPPLLQPNAIATSPPLLQQGWTSSHGSKRRVHVIANVTFISVSRLDISKPRFFGRGRVLPTRSTFSDAALHAWRVGVWRVRAHKCFSILGSGSHKCFSILGSGSHRCFSILTHPHYFYRVAKRRILQSGQKTHFTEWPFPGFSFSLCKYTCASLPAACVVV